MISQKDMLNIICTEAGEGPDWKHSVVPERRATVKDEPTVRYGVRLVKREDGTYKWED